MKSHEALRPIADPFYVLGAREGDPASQNALIEKVWPHAYRMAKYSFRDHEIAQDIAQDACVGMLRSIAKLDHAAAFDTWVIRIIVRTISRARRRTKPIDPLSDLAVAPGFQIEDAIDLSQAISNLSPNLRLIFTLDAIYGFNSREIGKAIGAPSPTVRYRLFRARAALRRALDATVPQVSAADYEKAVPVL